MSADPAMKRPGAAGPGGTGPGPNAQPNTWRDRLAPSPAFRWLTLAIVVAIICLIGSGAWVRLSESGLGCPTWPACSAHDLVANDNYHALVEFVNRCFIAAIAVLVAVAFLAAALARPRRRDLTWLAGGLIAGYIAEAVLGGITVLAKLAPALVASHLVLAMLLLADAVALYWQASGETSWAEGRRARDARLLGRLILLALSAVVVAGTVATGSGPHSGKPGTPRFGFRFPATVELHAITGMFLFGLVVAAFFVLRSAGAPPSLMRSYYAVLGAIALQGIIGYAQYFSGLPTGLVEVHEVGAAIVVASAVHLNLHMGPLDVKLRRRPASASSAGASRSGGPGPAPRAPDPVKVG